MEIGNRGTRMRRLMGFKVGLRRNRRKLDLRTSLGLLVQSRLIFMLIRPNYRSKCLQKIGNSLAISLK